MESVERQLGNDQFLAKAPEAVVGSLRQRKSELAVQQAKVTETLENLN
ncbi:MAG: hypothetical protein HYX72_06850 [Acidobacteria bacterium]|nr:hypothetical protein [Acidobacteriota bacterium]